MKIIFIHPNFPAQFRHLAAAFGSQERNQVVFVTATTRPDWEITGVRKVIYQAAASGPAAAPLANEFSQKQSAAKAVLDVLAQLRRNEAFVPDIIIGHSGWGTTFFVRDVYPEVPFLGYFEWYYNLHGSNLDFEPNSRPSLNTACNMRLRNSFIVNDLLACDQGLVATRWQKQQFPTLFQEKLVQLFDGIDTNYFVPAAAGQGLVLPDLDLSQVKKIITFTARGLEPYRGFPQFMEAMAKVLDQDREAHVVIAGGDRVCYGERRADGKSYKEHALQTIALDHDRVHFVGELPYGQYRKVLQSSLVHVYLTYPFVLSWSLFEAMACRCAVVASATPPVQEVIEDGVNGVLVDFFSPADIAAKVLAILTYPSMTASLRDKARKTVVDSYALEKLLPRQMALIHALIKASQQTGPFG